MPNIDAGFEVTQFKLRRDKAYAHSAGDRVLKRHSRESGIQVDFERPNGFPAFAGMTRGEAGDHPFSKPKKFNPKCLENRSSYKPSVCLKFGELRFHQRNDSTIDARVIRLI
jgi:hypothetical protein